MGFRVDTSDLMRGLSEMQLKAMSAVDAYGRAAAAKLEQTAKQDAAWKDRTGLARQTIEGVADWEKGMFRVGVAGNMEYFPYLEFTRNKQYAVLWPTVLKMQSEILSGMANLL